MALVLYFLLNAKIIITYRNKNASLFLIFFVFSVALYFFGVFSYNDLYQYRQERIDI